MEFPARPTAPRPFGPTRKARIVPMSDGAFQNLLKARFGIRAGFPAESPGAVKKMT